MRQITFTIFYIVLSVYAIAQENFSTSLNNAENSYSSGDLSSARFELQKAMIELDMVIGQEVLKLLPASIDGKESNESEDEVLVQGAGIVGLNVVRSYGQFSEDSGSIEFSLVNNSPMLQAINSFLINPMFMAAGTGQNMIKIQGYKSLIESNESDTGETTSITVQIPFGDSLLSLEFNNYTDEDKVVALVDEIDINAIAELVGQN